jgi:hypothetical protein
MIRSAKHALFRGAGRLAACDPSDTIVVVGSPRSGTTWLLELLRALPGYKAINEPFWYDEVRQAHGFAWRPHLAPGVRLSHLYRDALEPNYDVMNECQRPRWAW